MIGSARALGSSYNVSYSSCTFVPGMDCLHPVFIRRPLLMSIDTAAIGGGEDRAGVRLCWNKD